MFELVLVAALLATAVLFALFSSRAIDQASSRDEVARHLFLAGFDGSGVAPALLVQTFDALRARVPHDVDVMRPTDQLAARYGFTQADAEDVVLLVAARTDGHIPAARDLDRLGESVRTVADLVRFLVPFYTRDPRTLARAS